MAWIESHQSTGRHPKTKKFARLLGIHRTMAVGYLHQLWWWALDYAQDGDLSKYTADEIADGAEWEGVPELFVSALVESKYVDQNGERIALHDWYDYAGKLIEQREKDAERKREARAKSKNKNEKDIHKMSSGRPLDIQPPSACTVPNQPNQPNQPLSRTHAQIELVRAYEETFGLLTGPADDWLDLLHYMDKGMELELIIEAVSKSKHADVPAKYADTILKNQLRKGITSVTAAIDADEERKRKMNPALQQQERNGRYIPPGLAPEVAAAMEEDERLERQRLSQP